MTRTDKTKPAGIQLPAGQWLYAVPNMDRVYVTSDGTSVYAPTRDTQELRELPQYTRKDGTASVWANGKNSGVHQLVCRTFHGAPPSAQHIVARNNGNTADNRPENLRWDTKGRAMRAAFDRRNPPTERQRELAQRTAAANPSDDELARPTESPLPKRSR